MVDTSQEDCSLVIQARKGCSWLIQTRKDTSKETLYLFDTSKEALHLFYCKYRITESKDLDVVLWKYGNIQKTYRKFTGNTQYAKNGSGYI